MLYIGVYIVDRVSYINKLNLPNKKKCYPENRCTVMMIEEAESVQANCIYIYGPCKLNCKDLDGRPHALK